MITPPNIKRAKVSDLSEQGYSFVMLIPLTVECKSTKTTAPVKVSAVQLSKAVLWANRSDEIIVDLKYGRNGRKTAFVQSIPHF